MRPVPIIHLHPVVIQNNFQERFFSAEVVNSPEFQKSCASQYLRALQEEDFLSCYFLWSKYFNSDIATSRSFSQAWQQLLSQQSEGNQISQREISYQQRYCKIINAANSRTASPGQTSDIIRDLLRNSQEFGDADFINYIYFNPADLHFVSFRYQAAHRDLYRAIFSNDQDSVRNLLYRYQTLALQNDFENQSLNHLICKGNADIEMAQTIAENSAPGYGFNFSMRGEHPLIMACERQRYDLLNHFIDNCGYSGNVIDFFGRNPLRMVYEDQGAQNRIEICKKLIQRGAFDPDICSAMIQDLQNLSQMSEEQMKSFAEQIEINRKLAQELEESKKTIEQNEIAKAGSRQKAAAARDRNIARIAELEAENAELEKKLAEAAALLKIKTQREHALSEREKRQDILSQKLGILSQKLLEDQLSLKRYEEHLQKNYPGAKSFEEIISRPPNDSQSKSLLPSKEGVGGGLSSNSTEEQSSLRTETDNFGKYNNSFSSLESIGQVSTDPNLPLPPKPQSKKKQKTKASSGEKASSREEDLEFLDKIIADNQQAEVTVDELNIIAKNLGVKITYKSLSDINNKDSKGKGLIHYVALMNLNCDENENEQRFNLLERLIVKGGADVNLDDANGYTTLMSVCGEQRFYEVALLLQNEADLMLRDKVDGDSALHHACVVGSAAIAKQILEFATAKGQKDHLIDLVNLNGDTPLQHTCKEKFKVLIPEYTSVAIYLIEQGSDIRIKNKEGRSALHQSCIKGNLRVVEAMLQSQQKDEIINMADEDGNTPLHLACKYQKRDLALLLLNSGANFKIQNNGGKVAAALISDTDLKREIVLEQVKISKSNPATKAPKENLITDYSPEIRKIFEKYKIKFDSKKGINSADENGLSSIQKACVLDKVDEVKILFNSGFSIDLISKREGASLPHLCAYGMSVETLQYLLLERGLKADSKDSNGRNPLHYLVNEPPEEISITRRMEGSDFEDTLAKFKKIATALIKAGADLDEKDRYGVSPLQAFENISSPEEKAAVLNAIQEIRKDVAALNSQNPSGTTQLRGSGLLKSGAENYR